MTYDKGKPMESKRSHVVLWDEIDTLRPEKLLFRFPSEFISHVPVKPHSGHHLVTPFYRTALSTCFLD
jgi:hypothetical protein